MDKVSLIALARQHLAAAHDAHSGRSAHTVYGGHPATRHGLHAVDDCVVVLTVAKSVQRYGETTYDDDLPGL
jgi:hypothetical protein